MIAVSGYHVRNIMVLYPGPSDPNPAYLLIPKYCSILLELGMTETPQGTVTGDGATTEAKVPVIIINPARVPALVTVPSGRYPSARDPGNIGDG
jgi:hypothetical protein